MGWECLPFTVCYEIFGYLDYRDLVVASSVCNHWRMVSRDERLWKKLFFSKYCIDRTINNRGLTWYEEFKRLHYNIPTVQTEVIHQHFDQILHVTFSHNGNYFVTCSRDCLVNIWHSSHPAKLRDSLNMTVFNWRCAHYSEFNDSDTLLLVSGIVAGSETNTSGEIVVFYVEDFLNFQSGVLKMKCRIDNTPYSLFGTWYNDSFLLSGNRFWLGGFVTAALIYVNRASQETSSEHIPVTQGLFKFYKTNRSSLTSLLVAKCLRHRELDSQTEEESKLHFDKSSFNLSTPYESIPDEQLPPFYTLKYNSRYREYEDNIMFPIDGSDQFSYDSDVEDERSFSDESSSSETKSENEDKYLIFITGTNTFIPHEIGIKRIQSFQFPERIDPGPSLKERQMLFDERKRLMETGVDDINLNNIDALAEKFDTPDHIIDLHAHILGMRLSPDHRFLYVTIRRWPEWEHYNFFDVVDPLPMVQNDISLNVIDLVTLEIVGITTNVIRKTYSADADYYFIYMDVNEELISSTGEGTNLHIWDRHYGIHLSTQQHDDIVNAIAFNPRDPEMMVSVSDDAAIKIWRSPCKIREMGICLDDENNAWLDDSDSEISK